MSEEVERWYRGIPRIEKNQALVISDGYAYTPEQVVSETRAGTELGKKLKRVVEERRFTKVEDKYALAAARLRERFERIAEQTPGMRLYSISDRSYTAQEMLDSLEEGDGPARSLVEAEVTRIEDVLRDKRRV